MGTRRTLGAVALLLAACGGVVSADTGYENEDLSVRLASAFERFTEVSAFGGETVANRWTPTSNPASADWTPPEHRLGGAAAGFLSTITFDAPTTLRVYGAAGAWHTNGAGTGNLILSQVRSNDKADLQGLTFDYATDVLHAQWAKRWDRVGAGFSFNYADSQVTQTTGGLTVRHSTAKTYRLRGGMLAEPVCGLVVGAIAEYAWSPFKYDALVPTPGGLVPLSGDDTQEQIIARVGASYEYRPYSVVYADYQYATFENDRDELTTHRFSGGIQHNAFRFLFLRAGITADDRGNVGYLAGVGAALGPDVVLDLGYQYDTLPELTPSFGVSETIQLTLSIRF